MLYTQDDKNAVVATARQRAWVVWLPTALMAALAIITLIVYRSNHDESGWILSALLTILGGAYCIFFFGVYLRPVLKYKKHLQYMLEGRKRETTGTLVEISDDILDKEGIDCYSVMVNIGDTNDPEDDRQFYLDAYKSLNDFAIGDHVHIESNDRMIASIEKV